MGIILNRQKYYWSASSLEAIKLFDMHHGFKVWTGTCYRGGYIRDDKSQRVFLKERTATYERNICTIIETTGKYTQEIYTTVVRAIQSEWIFIQHITTDTGDAFAGVEKMIWEIFLPCLFSGKTKLLSPIVGNLSTIPSKKSRLGLRNPVMSVNEKCRSSQKEIA